jgi:hypothetical protein
LGKSLKELFCSLLIRLDVLFGPVVPIGIVEEGFVITEHQICFPRKSFQKCEFWEEIPNLPATKKRKERIATVYH